MAMPVACAAAETELLKLRPRVGLESTLGYRLWQKEVLIIADYTLWYGSDEDVGVWVWWFSKPGLVHSCL